MGAPESRSRRGARAGAGGGDGEDHRPGRGSGGGHEALSRAREAAVEKFNDGSLAAAVWMLDVAEDTITEKKLDIGRRRSDPRRGRGRDQLRAVAQVRGEQDETRRAEDRARVLSDAASGSRSCASFAANRAPSGVARFSASSKRTARAAAMRRSMSSTRELAARTTSTPTTSATSSTCCIAFTRESPKTHRAARSKRWRRRRRPGRTSTSSRKRRRRSARSRPTRR